MATVTTQERTNILKLVAGMFNAAPGAAYLNEFTDAYVALNKDLGALAAGLGQTGAFQSLYPSFLTADEFANKFLDTLGLKANTEAQDWVKAKVNAGESFASVVFQALVAIDASTSADFKAAKDQLANKAAVAEHYSVTLQASSDDLAALQNVVAKVTADPKSVEAANQTNEGGNGKTFTLTTSPDNVVGTAGNDTINGYIGVAATATTLTAADVIDGGAGTDSLKLTVEGTGTAAGAGSLPNASISNVEQFFIRDVATAASNYDFGTIQGEQQVWADTATNGVIFSNLGAGTTVGLKGNNVLTNLGNVSFSMAPATDAVSIAIDGGVKNTTAPTITATAGTATAATISSTGAANTVGAITLTAGGSTVTTLNINAATNLTAVLTAADFAATAKMVVTGAGKVNVGAGFDGATIDASGNTGGLTASTTAGVTKLVEGSSAADSITLVGALAAGGKINLGAGDDKLLTGAGASITATTIVDGGDGLDSISAALINAANAGAIKNFELLDVSATSNLDVELVTGSTIQGLTLSGGTGGGTVTNVAAGAGLTVTGNNTGTTTIGVKGAASATSTADSFTTTFAGVATSAATAAAPELQAAGTVVTNGVEALNIVSGGTGFVTNSMTVTDNALQTITITGDKALNLAFAGVNGTVVTGATDTVNGVKMIDGSAATGALTINTNNVTNVANAGLTVKTGAGKDSITLTQKATVDAGAGDDLIVSSVAGGKFTGGAGADKFDVSAAIAVAGSLTEATGAFKNAITDFSSTDSIKLLGGNTSFTTTKIALGASVTNLDQALAQATVTPADNSVTWFQYGADTYVVANDGTLGFGAGDLVVKLTGLVDLTSATLDTTSDYLTLA
ncbi:hypothetical protein J1777_07255 [Comamonas denitrificans]|uniref:S-layer protein n=1 Tax=Comamonas denitrificans TaxID=117506 RepID=A0A939GZJ3_9BURK|nr:bluetail domain-containing putative surface protein [Comamonas denitrificans]MBO1249628.1 hypothetical protein [Comamonas denitrificans]